MNRLSSGNHLNPLLTLTTAVALVLGSGACSQAKTGDSIHPTIECTGSKAPVIVLPGDTFSNLVESHVETTDIGSDQFHHLLTGIAMQGLEIDANRANLGDPFRFKGKIVVELPSLQAGRAIALPKECHKV